nr:MAG TPA: hypothetical protein [Caudoviricetes sp.]
MVKLRNSEQNFNVDIIFVRIIRRSDEVILYERIKKRFLP